MLFLAARHQRADNQDLFGKNKKVSAKEGRDIGGILPLTQNPIVNRRSARGGEQL